MSEPEKTNLEAGAVKKKSGKKLIIIVLAVLLLGGSGGGLYYWRAASVSAAENAAESNEKTDGKKSRAKKHDDESDHDSEAEETDKPAKKSTKSAASESLRTALPDDEDVKHIIELQPFIVNLADTDQARYLRLTVNLGIGGDSGGGGHDKPDPLFTTRVRNAMLAVLSIKSSTDVLTGEGKAKLRKELLKAAQAAAADSHVEAIYITDFIVQL